MIRCWTGIQSQRVLDFCTAQMQSSHQLSGEFTPLLAAAVCLNEMTRRLAIEKNSPSPQMLLLSNYSFTASHSSYAGAFFGSWRYFKWRSRASFVSNHWLVTGDLNFPFILMPTFSIVPSPDFAPSLISIVSGIVCDGLNDTWAELPSMKDVALAGLASGPKM